MAIALGLAAALTYGAADFFGGLVTRRTDVFGVVVVSQLIGSAMLFVALPFFLDMEPTGRALLWGGLAGVAGGAGVTLFYQALALGRMSVIAPVTGVEAAGIPVIWGLVSGERPSEMALSGVLLALIAVVLVSSVPDPAPERALQRAISPGLVYALGAGVGFGAFFILLSEAGEGGGLWPLVSARVASVVLVAGIAFVARRPLRPARGTMPGIAGAGLFDVTANILYLAATRRGLLSIVAVLTSMYPASTVVLARIFLRERIVRLQLVGLLVAVMGVVLMGIG